MRLIPKNMIKIGSSNEGEPAFYSASLAARELGRNILSNKKTVSSLNKIVSGGSEIGRVLSSMYNKPLHSIAFKGIGILPQLIEEGKANSKGYKSLKEQNILSEDQLKQVRNTLMAFTGANAINASSKLAPNVISTLNAPLIFKLLASKLIANSLPTLVNKAVKKINDRSPTITTEELEELAKTLGVPTQRKEIMLIGKKIIPSMNKIGSFTCWGNLATELIE
jgi:hypothetical protein